MPNLSKTGADMTAKEKADQKYAIAKSYENEGHPRKATEYKSKAARAYKTAWEKTAFNYAQALKGPSPKWLLKAEKFTASKKFPYIAAGVIAPAVGIPGIINAKKKKKLLEKKAYTKNEIEGITKDLAKSTYGISRVSKTKPLRDFKLDDLDIVEGIMKLEDKFKKPIPEGNIIHNRKKYDSKTLKDLVNYLHKNQK
jgi:acyl carrier protein